jgi:hypothetical protein
MIEYITLFLIIYGWAAIFQITGKMRNPYEFAAACSSIIITLYFFSIFQCLKYGLYATAIVGIVGIIFSIKKIIINPEYRFEALQRTLTLTIIFCIAFIASWGLDYSVWDEFSHWGTQVEYLLINKNLHTDSKLLLFPDYIPGLSLWRYFGRVALRHAGPSGSYFINYIFIFSCVYAIAYSNSVFKSIFKSCILFLGMLIFFQSLVGALYADPIQAILLLLALKIASEEDSSNFIYLLLTTAAIVLCKHVGLIFAFFIACYYVTIQIYAFKKQKSKIFLRAGLIVILTIAFYFSWSIYLKYYSITKSGVDISGLISGDVFDLLKIMREHIGGVLSNQYPHANYSKPAVTIAAMSPGISLLTFWLTVLSFGGILIFMSVKSNRIYSVNFVFLITASVLYLLFLAFIRVATVGLTGDIFSFTRYFVVLLFPGLFLIILPVLELSFKRMFILGSIVIGVYLIAAPQINTILVHQKRSEPGVSAEYKAKANLVKKYANLKNVIWYVNAEASPAYYIFRMRVLPLEVKSYWIGAGLYLDGALKTTEDLEKRVERFSRMLCDVDLMFIDTVPDEFWIQYASLFDKTKGQVYKVKTGLNGHCSAGFLE